MSDSPPEKPDDLNTPETLPALPPRVPTGLPGLDRILGGGLFQAGIYLIAGPPGSGKTILANQLCFYHVAAGGRAMYITLLAESHARMLGHLQTFSFFSADAVGQTLKYINGFKAIENEGLAGLLQLLRGAVREHRATLLVLDGMMTASVLARSGTDYKKFINELQTWAGMYGCTVLFLTSADLDGAGQPEHTMVDGICELGLERLDMKTMRKLTVHKFRGSGFAEGGHTYVITRDGLVIYPRLESLPLSQLPERANGKRLGTGIAALDRLMGGGLAYSSTTLFLGSSGSGKTIFGLHFLAAGAQAGEPGLLFGFFENPAEVIHKANRLGLGLDTLCERGDVTILWQPAAEQLLDALGERLLRTVRERGIKRLFIDGLVGFKEADHSGRLAGYFAVLAAELAVLGVTTIITEETRELFVREIQVPTPGVSAIFQNIIFFRQVEVEAELLRLLSVMKTRDSAHARALYQFDITDHGIEIGLPFQPSRNVLTGVSQLLAEGPPMSTGGKHEGER
ncbi:MAG TPA: ATPase domain-containing protein [Polyangia bacterium]|jgi:circadian clock protein KaiC|nr:ATPase domain-containing protein [Polyangia bacterium]